MALALAASFEKQDFDYAGGLGTTADTLAELRKDFTVSHLELENDALSTQANQRIKETKT